MKKINLFISYSHQEKNDYLKELLNYLNENDCPKINIWYDNKINPGNEWDENIKTSLNNADIVILLLSQSFLTSRYIQENELKTAIEKHKAGKCMVIPIFIRPCMLNNYTDITKLQGLPVEKAWIAEAGEKRWGYYENIVLMLNSIADKLAIESNLSNNKKIFLSIPATIEGKLKRKQFLYQVEGKRKYENWEYEIVPNLSEVEEINTLKEQEKAVVLNSILKDSLYAIHIIESDEDILHEKSYQPDNDKCTSFKNVVWLINQNLKLSKEMSMNPIVTGTDYESLFVLIKSLDDEKTKKINDLKKTISPDKKVFIFYDFHKDHDNKLRICLKTKLEDNPNVFLKFSVPDASYERDRDDINNCDGAFIFYGSTDPQWFAMRQSILIDAGFALSKGICVDEPDIKIKVSRDVSKNAFITIEGEPNLEFGVKNFVDQLNITGYENHQ